jgi:hypothetical protein
MPSIMRNEMLALFLISMNVNMKAIVITPIDIKFFARCTNDWFY